MMLHSCSIAAAHIVWNNAAPWSGVLVFLYKYTVRVQLTRALLRTLSFSTLTHAHPQRIYPSKKVSCIAGERYQLSH